MSPTNQRLTYIQTCKQLFPEIFAHPDYKFDVSLPKPLYQLNSSCRRRAVRFFQYTHKKPPPLQPEQYISFYDIYNQAKESPAPYPKFLVDFRGCIDAVKLAEPQLTDSQIMSHAIELFIYYGALVGNHTISTDPPAESCYTVFESLSDGSLSIRCFPDFSIFEKASDRALSEFKNETKLKNGPHAKNPLSLEKITNNTLLNLYITEQRNTWLSLSPKDREIIRRSLMDEGTIKNGHLHFIPQSHNMLLRPIDFFDMPLYKKLIKAIDDINMTFSRTELISILGSDRQIQRMLHAGTLRRIRQGQYIIIPPTNTLRSTSDTPTHELTYAAPQDKVIVFCEEHGIAYDQDRIYKTKELNDLGISKTQITRYVKSGLLVRGKRGEYTIGGGT